jgi:hypothetical protein
MPDFNTIRFLSGRPLLRELGAERLNTILAEIKRNKPKGERGISVRQDGTGTYIGLAASLPRGGTSIPITLRPLQLSIINEGTTETPDWKVRVLPSTVAGGSALDLGFSEGDDPPFLLEAAEGVVQAIVTIDETGAVVDRAIEIAETLTADTDTEFYVEIGTASYDGETETWSVNNSRYGPIDATICRDWFSNPPTYSVTFFAVTPYA